MSVLKGLVGQRTYGEIIYAFNITDSGLVVRSICERRTEPNGPAALAVQHFKKWGRGESSGVVKYGRQQ